MTVTDSITQAVKNLAKTAKRITSKKSDLPRSGKGTGLRHFENKNWDVDKQAIILTPQDQSNSTMESTNQNPMVLPTQGSAPNAYTRTGPWLPVPDLSFDGSQEFHTFLSKFDMLFSLYGALAGLKMT
ncbi:hypothetical protein R1flu_012795 [Riccia fluitans]|uniref:Uncharacterized protein n=1 Tax=Riccia fluitans TaxID=41844 RepID=A0ABD1ZBL8_9MARC